MEPLTQVSLKIEITCDPKTEERDAIIQGIMDNIEAFSNYMVRQGGEPLLRFEVMLLRMYLLWRLCPPKDSPLAKKE